MTASSCRSSKASRRTIARSARALKDNGLRATAVCVIPDTEHDCTSSDAKGARCRAQPPQMGDRLPGGAGGEVLCGPFYQPLGVFSGNPPTKEERNGIVEVHKEAAQHAAKQKIKIAVEPLNRFECYALNTVRPTPPRSSSASTSRTTAILYDTFHANIEEKDPVGVIAPNIEADQPRPYLRRTIAARRARGTSRGPRR